MKILKRLLFAFVVLITAIFVMVWFPLSSVLSIFTWIFSGRDVMLTSGRLITISDYIDKYTGMDEFFNNI